MTTLHHETVETRGAGPSRRMFLLHGIYGAGRNWGSVARRLVRARPGWSVSLVDLRSHGRSPRLSPHTVDACASDLLRIEDHLDRPPDAVLGHSFGGKVALLYARERAARDGQPGGGPAKRASGLKQLWVIDSNPGTGRPGGSAWRMLGVLRRHPGPFGSRAEAVATVESEGFSTPVAAWIATNARPDGLDGWEWRLDPAEMEAYLRDYFRSDAWDVVESPPAGAEIHFVKATGSDVLDPAAVERIREAGRATGQVFLHEVEGGHWLNTDNPAALHKLLAVGLP